MSFLDWGLIYSLRKTEIVIECSYLHFRQLRPYSAGLPSSGTGIHCTDYDTDLVRRLHPSDRWTNLESAADNGRRSSRQGVEA